MTIANPSHEYSIITHDFVCYGDWLVFATLFLDAGMAQVFRPEGTRKYFNSVDGVLPSVFSRRKETHRRVSPSITVGFNAGLKCKMVVPVSASIWTGLKPPPALRFNRM
jgi:hypothetical protein